MPVKNEKKLEDFIVKLGLVTKKQLDLIKVQSTETGQSLEKILRGIPSIKQEELCKVLAVASEMPYVDLTDRKIDPIVLNILTNKVAEKYKIVPFGKLGEYLNVAMTNPNDVQSIEYIEKKTGMKVKPYLVSADSIQKALAQYDDYTIEVDTVMEDIQKIQEDNDPVKEDKSKNKLRDAEKITQDAPITRALNTILEYAAKSRASDVHIEPREKDVKIRYRIDGILYNTMTLPKHIHPAIISRIKILSSLKIDEHRVPQDGRFQLKIEGREVDLRISVTPIVYGEKIVIRLLDKSNGIITLENLGITGRAYKIIEAGIKKPHGMILATGPTGSGKSTSLYAVLTKLNKPSVNIITIEDPVEYNVDGINQIQVNNGVGLTFASGLRSMLRQDPDVIMVGEIRDKETADLAVQSALTGHTVLSTLHTNSAASTLPRLTDMDIEPFLIASTVNTIIGQRLVRMICESCKEEVTLSAAVTDAIKSSLKDILPSKKSPQKKTADLETDKLPFAEQEKFKVYKGKGCEACKNTGFWGRIGIYEVFNVTQKVEDLIISRASASEINEAAVTEGMISMRQDGFLKVLAGITTLEEVVRITSED